MCMMMGLAAAHTVDAAASAGDDTVARYSHAIPVNFNSRGSLVQLRLPRDVYLQAHSPSLDDVRLFDSQGRNVPFALTTPDTQRGASRRTMPAKVFALNADAANTTGTLAIRTNADGTLLSVESHAGKPATGTTLAGLLIDLNPAAQGQPMFSALAFTAPPGVANYSARVTIEASDDLQDWHSVTEGRLDWLSNSASDTLANNRIVFEPSSMRYVRLRWREGEPRMFGAIAAEGEVIDVVAVTPDTLQVAAQPGEFPGDLIYPIGKAVPLRTIGMELADTGTVAPVEIGRYVAVPVVPGAAVGRPAHRVQFAPILRTTFYKIMQNGAVRTPSDVIIAPLSVDRLVVRPQTALTSQPVLHIGWTPATLIFATREAGPYTLAFGRDNVRSSQAALADVAPGYRPPELLALEKAVAGPVKVQHLAEQETSDATRAGMSATTRTAALWGTLILGVLVLGLLTWRMVKSPVTRDDSEKRDGAKDNEPGHG